MSEQNLRQSIFATVVDYVNVAESTNLENPAKKVFVKKQVEIVLGDEDYARYEPIIDDMIDGLVSVMNKETKLLLRRTGSVYVYIRRLITFCKGKKKSRS